MEEEESITLYNAAVCNIMEYSRFLMLVPTENSYEICQEYGLVSSGTDCKLISYKMGF